MRFNPIWRPFTQMLTGEEPLKVTRTKDSLLYLEDGRKVIDAISSWWVITHGHCQESIANAVAEQAHQIDQILFANLSHQTSEDLIDELKQHLDPSLEHFFFSDNGSTAVEVALKTTIQYWKNLGSERRLFLSFSDSYHGDTVGAMSVGGRSVFTRPYEDLLFTVKSVKQGRYSWHSIKEFTDPFIEAFEEHKDHLAGIIIEPLIQGAGGMIVWPREALNKIGKLAQDYGVPIIFDEVMTGFGRTGDLFAYQPLDFVPDLLCLSKGLTAGMLPLSLTVCRRNIYEAFLSEKKEKMLFHGHSFTANPISCAAALANLKLLKQKDMKQEWQRIESIQQKRVAKYFDQSFVKDARYLGTMGAIELTDQQEGYVSNITQDLMKFALEREVFLRPLGNVIYVLPPYCIQNDELHQVWDVIDAYCERF